MTEFFAEGAIDGVAAVDATTDKISTAYAALQGVGALSAGVDVIAAGRTIELTWEPAQARVRIIVHNPPVPIATIWRRSPGQYGEMWQFVRSAFGVSALTGALLAYDYEMPIDGRPSEYICLPGTEAPSSVPTDVTLMTEPFSSYFAETEWAEGSQHGPWFVAWKGWGGNTSTQGSVKPVDVSGNRALQLEAHLPAPDTSSSLVRTSSITTVGDVEIEARVRTVAQLKASPNPWEVAWLGWNWHDDGDGAKFYYVALKTNGIELGKSDQSQGPDWQRFLVTDSTAFTVGTWYTVRVRQEASRIRVWVDAGAGEVLRADFTDGPGSGGTPGYAGEGVYGKGQVVLYHEDARVQFDDVTITKLAVPTPAGPFTSIAPQADQPWLRHLTVPARSTPVVVQSVDEVTRPGRSGVFEVVNRSEPVTVHDVRGSRRGSVRLLTRSAGEAEAVRTALREGAPLYLQLHDRRVDFEDCYMDIGDAAEARVNAYNPASASKLWTLPFVEVSRPVGGIEPEPQTTYGEVLAVGTYEDVRTKWDSYLAILIGEESSGGEAQ